MTQPFLLTGGLVLLGLGLGLMLLALVFQRRSLKAGGIRARSDRSDVGRVYLVAYRIISKNLLCKHAVSNIRSRIEIVGNTNERTIRKKTVQIFAIILTIMTGLLMAIIVVTKQVLLILLFVVVLWFLAETLVDFFVIRLRNRLLKQQIKLNDLIRHKYYETGMVDEAIYLACQSLDKDHYEIGLQGQRIHDVLMAKDVEKEMMTYNDTAPNKFLRMLLGLAYITMEYGDNHKDGSSAFMRNLSDLTGELRIELAKREQLNYALKSLNVIVLVPLFCITPIRQWASSYFVPLKVFYESQAGFFLEVVTIGMIFVCYLLLRRIQQFEDNRRIYRKNPLEQRLYDRYLFHLVDGIKPRKGRYHTLKRKLKNSASPLTVEAFTSRQLMTFAFGLVFAMIFLVALHYNQRHQVFTGPTLPESFLGGQLSEEEMARAEAITAEDNIYLSQMTAVTSEEDLLTLLEDKGLPIEETKIIARRLLDKHLILANQTIKWWEVALVIGFGLVCFHLPSLYLVFQQKVVKIDIEDEVAGFTTIILMLMHHERLSVIDLLEWMEMFSKAFKEPIEDCLNNTASGLTEALELLREVSENEGFNSIVDSLILASEDITITQAFDELASEKEFYIEARKETNRRIVEGKINLGRMVGFVPVYGLIILYMIVPMISTSMHDMQQYFNQLSF